MRPRLLAVSGHDPTGGAGVQADIEAAADCGVPLSTLVTALTVQDGENALKTRAVEVELLDLAATTLCQKLEFSGIKFGLLPTVASVEWALELCDALPLPIKVCDPVLTASGGALMTDSGVGRALCELLIPKMHVVTPNRSELTAVTGHRSPKRAAETLLKAGADWVLMTDTDHPDPARKNEIEHRLFGSCGEQSFRVARMTGSFHGSGCRLATAIAALLSLGRSVPDAVEAALKYCNRQLCAATDAGGVLLPRPAGRAVL